MVNYLVDQNVKAEDIIVNSGLHPGLDVILSGPIPPDPETILSRRLRTLIADLRKTYDTIILDTPPVGLVADALQLKDLPQATMYVVRAGYTRLPQLKVIEEIRVRQKLPKPFIVLNGVRFDGGSGHLWLRLRVFRRERNPHRAGGLVATAYRKGPPDESRTQERPRPEVT